MIPKDPKHVFVSLEERQAIEEKARVRMANREYFIKEISNPFRQIYGQEGYVSDPAILRVEAERTFLSNLKYFQPSFKNFASGMLIYVIPIVSFTYATYKIRAAFEDRCRRGEISYADRRFKFI